MIKLVDFLKESIEDVLVKDLFKNDKNTRLLYMMHINKYDIIGNNLKSINDIIENNLELSKKPLYRGFGAGYNLGTLSKEKNVLDQIFYIGDILSFSEDLKVGQEFAKRGPSKIIIKLIDAEGFKYYEYLKNKIKEEIEQKKYQKKDMKSIESTLRLLDYEKEWFIPQETKFKVIDIKITKQFTTLVCKVVK
jgi:hypothetical protein